MRRVRLFPDAWSVLHAAPAAPRGPGCSACSLHEGSALVGVQADGRPGGLLVVGLSARGTARRPFAGRDEALLRSTISRHWSGPVAYDSALRCVVDRGTRVTLAMYREEVEACRPFTSEVVADVAPERVLAFGPQAAASLLGVVFPEPGGRQVYGWIPVGGRAVPVFLLQHAETYRENTHLERWTTEDLAWALRVDLADLPPPQHAAEYLRCEDPGDVRQAVEELRSHGRISHDVETRGRTHDRDFRVFALGLATVERQPRVWMLPEHVLRDPAALSELRRLYRDRDVEVSGHNNKYDASAVSELIGVPDLPVTLGGTDLQRKLQEVDVLARLSVASLRVGMGGHKDEAAQAKARARKWLLSLRGKAAKDPAQARRTIELAASVRDPRHYDDWAAEECLREGVPLDPAGSRAGRRRLIDDWLSAADPRAHHDPDSYAYGLAARGTMETYCARDVVAAALLDLRESDEVDRHPVHRRTYHQVVRPSIRAVSQMERWGVPVDRVALEAFSTLLYVEMGQVIEECRRYGLEEPGSDEKVADLLFRQLRLPVEFYTDKERKPSVKDEALARLDGRHPVVAAVRQHRTLQKMLGNYATGLLKHVRSDGRVHPSFRIAGAETGRMSCADPNMQTIPTRGKWARLAKSVYTAPRGRILVQLDYNQMELRIAAHLSGDEEMLRIFQEGQDYHAATAAFVAPIVWHREYRKLSSEEAAADPVLAQQMSDMRRTAKVYNFGLIYGKGDQSIAEEVGITLPEAAAVREAILGKFKTLDHCIHDHINFCRRNGFARTFHADGSVARLRPLPDVSSRAQEYRGHAERASWNTPVQGSAADYLVRSLVRSVDYILRSGVDAQVDLQVHDSMLLEVGEDDVEEVVAEVRGHMLDFGTRCPLVVDEKRGRSWGDLE